MTFEFSIATGSDVIESHTEGLNFPVKNAQIQVLHSPGDNVLFHAFVTKTNPSAPGPASVVYSTLFGGNTIDGAFAIGVDQESTFAGDVPTGNSYQIGDTYVANFNFATPGPTILLYENGGGLSAIAQPTIAPGLVFTLKGDFIGPSTSSLAQLDPKTGRLATNLEGVQVLVNGIACLLVYVSAMQINAIAPYELASASEAIAYVQVVYKGVAGSMISLTIAPTAAGILSFDDGTGQGVILNQDGSINGTKNPATRGTIVTIFATGEGQTSPQGIDGGLATNLSNLPHPVAPVSVTIGNLPATDIKYAGTAPEEVYGLLQVNVTVPAGVTPGPAVPVVVKVGGVSSQAGLTMAVK